MKYKKKRKNNYTQKKILKTLLEISEYMQWTHSLIGDIKHTVLRIESDLKQLKEYEDNKIPF